MARALVAAACVAAVSGAALMGIDLGNEFMKVSIVKPGMPFQVVTNFQSKRKTPSLVALYDRERLFGADAESLAGRKPTLVVGSSHAVLGRNSTNELLEQYRASPFTAVKTETNARGGLSYVFPSGDAVARPASTAAGADAAVELDTVTYSAEEMTAMLLSHAVDFASAVAGIRVNDAVVCVPSFWTQSERAALLDAMALTQTRVTALVDENVGAAIQYGIDRVFENETHFMMLYNMGAESTQVTLMAYDAYNATVSGKVRAVGQGRVLAKAWDTALGGRHFDRAIIDWAVAKFDAEQGKKLPKSANGSVRNVAAAMAKLRKNVIRTKEILSANEEFQMFVESILPDIDFRATLSRAQLDSIADKAGLLARITPLIDSVVAQANISLSSVSAVELLGGGVRIPRVQAVLRDYLNASGVPVGQHMNGDESMALGAAFLAANRSASFRVRKVGIIDGFPFAIGTRVTLLHASDAAAAGASHATEVPHASEVVEEHGSADTASASATPQATASGKAWSKRSSLFRAYNPLESTKRITFSSERDLRVALFYEVPNAGMPALPAGTSRYIAYYNVTGVEELLRDEKLAALGVPKIHLAYDLDINGMAHLSRAEATLEEEYIPTPTPTPASRASAASNDSDVNATTAAETAQPSPAATASASTENATEANATAALAPRKRTHRFPLTVIADVAVSGSVHPLSAQEKADSLAALRHLNKLDDERRAKEGAKNALEAFIYSTRDRMSNNEEDLPSVSTTDQRESITVLLSEDEDWLYGDGASATTVEYKAKLTDLKAIVDPVFFRLEELRGRPKLLNDTRTQISTARSLIKAFPITHPQINANETSDIEAAVASFEKWFEGLVEQQAGVASHETPVLTRELVSRRVKSITEQLTRLLRKPKPTPTPTPKPRANATQTNSTRSEEPAADSTAEGSESTSDDAAGGDADTPQADGHSDGAGEGGEPAESGHSHDEL